MRLYPLYSKIPLVNKIMFKIPVTVFKKRGDTWVPYYDWGRIVGFIKEAEVEVNRIYLRYERAHAPFPSSEYMRGDKSIVYIETGDKVYVPANVVIDSKMKKIILKEFETGITLAKAAITQEVKESVNVVRNQSFWEKYGNVIMPVVYFAVAGLLIIMILKESAGYSAALGGVTKQLASLVDKVGQLLQGINMPNMPPPG